MLTEVNFQKTRDGRTLVFVGLWPVGVIEEPFAPGPPFVVRSFHPMNDVTPHATREDAERYVRDVLGVTATEKLADEALDGVFGLVDQLAKERTAAYEKAELERSTPYVVQ